MILINNELVKIKDFSFNKDPKQNDYEVNISFFNEKLNYDDIFHYNYFLIIENQEIFFFKHIIINYFDFGDEIASLIASAMFHKKVLLKNYKTLNLESNINSLIQKLLRHKKLNRLINNN